MLPTLDKHKRWSNVFETSLCRLSRSDIRVHMSRCRIHTLLLQKQWLRDVPRKHFNVVSTLVLGWYGCRSRTSSNKRWINLAFVNVGIYNVEQRQIIVVYFKLDLNNVRQRRNNVVIFNVNLHNVEPRRNNAVNIWPLKKWKN